MAKDPYITKDDYHIEDILRQGRCLWCGRLAQPEHSSKQHKFCSDKCGRAYTKMHEIAEFEVL